MDNFGELLGELAGRMFGSQEQNPAAGARGQPIHQLLFGLGNT
jgi:hypothetical protein